MSSLSRTKNGDWKFQMMCLDDKRREVRFSKGTSKKNAETLQSNFDRLLEARRLNEPLDVRTQNWLKSQPEMILKKLVKLQLIKHHSKTKVRQTVAGWTDCYVQDFGHKHETKRKLRNVAEKLVEFFGSDTLLQDVTRGEATRFFVRLHVKS